MKQLKFFLFDTMICFPANQDLIIARYLSDFDMNYKIEVVDGSYHKIELATREDQGNIYYLLTKLSDDFNISIT